MANSESNLLIVNNAAGAGRATDAARLIGRATDIASMTFQDLIACSPKEIEQLLVPLSTLFVLGGDGSTFSLLQLLLQLQQHNPSFTEKTVVALGSGGENVISKHMHTFNRDKLGIVTTVLEGNYQKTQLDYGLIHPAEATEAAYFWNVHVGFSSDALYRIEQLRALGVGDRIRRYKGVLRAVANTSTESKVIYSLNGRECEPVLDFGVIAAQLPYWTSKVLLDVPESAPAVLHTIATPDSFGGGRYDYALHLLLELISLAVGSSSNSKEAVVKHTPLSESDTLEILSSPTRLAVDSEVTQYSSGRIALPQRREKNGVYIAKMR